MKKISSVFCLLSLLVLSCNKKDDSKTTLGNDKNAMDYRLAGVADFTIIGNGTYALPLSVEHVSGQQEPINISVVNLPSGVTAVASSASGTPPFASIVTFSAESKVGNGTYPIKIKTTTQSGVTKEFGCNMTTVADCMGMIIGEYDGNEICGTDKDNYYISVIMSSENKIIINNFYDMNFNVNADLNCTNHTINIPTQTLGTGSYAAKLSGTGTFDDTQFKMDYTFVFVDGRPTVSCTAIFNKRP